MRVSIGVFGAENEQINFLNSCGIIYNKIENESEFKNFTHIITFGKTSGKLRRKFISSIMLEDEQIDIFAWSKTLSKGKYGGLFSFEVINNITMITCLIPMDLCKKPLVIRKGFFVGQRKLPAEEIPLLDKGGLQRLFLSAMKEIFHSQNLPFVIKSFSPDPKKIPLLFRIDTDFCDEKTIDNFCESIKSKPKITCFAHTKYLGKAPAIPHEIALHCFSHNVKPTNENLQKGIEVLKKFGKTPLGFCAPYGVRNEEADIFLKQNHGFEYSSDFSFAADALPFFVEKTGLWQIPVFPICVGSFNGVCSDEEKITAVFERYFARNFKYKIPFIIYDHPNHTKFNLLNKIFAAANKYPILPMTFLEYCEFLKKREVSGDDFPTITFYPDESEPNQKMCRIMRQKISRLSLRLIKNTIINRRRRNCD